MTIPSDFFEQAILMCVEKWRWKIRNFVERFECILHGKNGTQWITKSRAFSVFLFSFYLLIHLFSIRLYFPEIFIYLRKNESISNIWYQLTVSACWFDSNDAPKSPRTAHKNDCSKLWIFDPILLNTRRGCELYGRMFDIKNQKLLIN